MKKQTIKKIELVMLLVMGLFILNIFEGIEMYNKSIHNLDLGMNIINIEKMMCYEGIKIELVDETNIGPLSGEQLHRAGYFQNKEALGSIFIGFLGIILLILIKYKLNDFSSK